MKRTRVWAWTGVVLLFSIVCLQAQESAPATIAGSGKPNFIPIWKNSTTLSSSTLFERSGKVGIGTTTPAATLEVNGTSKFDQAVTFASGQTFPGAASLGPNTFAGTQTIASGDLSISNGNLDLPATTGATTGVITMGGGSFIHTCCGSANLDTFVGLAAGNLSPSDEGYNAGFGLEALHANTFGSFNTSVGGLSLLNNTTGFSNTATGYHALVNNISGVGNTANGVEAMDSNVSGTANAAFGGSALDGNTTGSNNVGVGDFAGDTSHSGSNNTFLGYNSNSGSQDNLNNSTAIGANAVVSASNAMVLGSTAAQNGSANVNVGIDVGNPSNIFTVLQGGGPAISDGWNTYSSRRWKSDIRPLEGSLGKVERLQGVSYTYTANGKHDIGMIAEDVGKVVPEVVSYEANGKDAQGIDYARLTALLVEAVKQQQAEIRHQQAQIDTLKSEVRALEETK